MLVGRYYTLNGEETKHKVFSHYPEYICVSIDGYGSKIFRQGELVEWSQKSESSKDLKVKWFQKNPHYVDFSHFIPTWLLVLIPDFVHDLISKFLKIS